MSEEAPLVIPVAGSAADAVKEKVGADTATLYDSGLLPEDAAEIRAATIAEQLPVDGLFPDCSPALRDSIERSLRWATAVDVGIRWAFAELRGARLNTLDAFGTCCRIALGLSERPAYAAEPVVDRLVTTATRLEAGTGESDGSISRRLRDFVRFARTGEARSAPWPRSRIDLAIGVQPLILTAELAGRLLGAADTAGREELMRAFSGSQYLAVDLVSMVHRSHGPRQITATGAIDPGDLESDLERRESVAWMRTTMLRADERLRDLLGRSGLPLDNEVVAGYITATHEAVAFADSACRDLVGTSFECTGRRP